MRLELIYEHSAGAVHRLDGEVSAVDDCGVHIFLIVIPVTGAFPKLAVEHHRSAYLNIAVSLVNFSPVVDKGVAENHALREEACLFTGAHLRIRIPTGSEAPGRSVPRKESTRRELLICMFSSANIPARIPNGSLRIRYSLYSTSFSQPHFLKNNTVWSANISLT